MQTITIPPCGLCVDSPDTSKIQIINRKTGRVVLDTSFPPEAELKNSMFYFNADGYIRAIR